MRFLTGVVIFMSLTVLGSEVCAQAKDFNDPEVQAEETARLEKYSSLFAENAQEVSDEMAYDCVLFMNLTLRSALQRYGSDSRMTNEAMMALNTTNAGWKKLWAKRRELNQAIEGGELHNAIASGNVAYVRKQIPNLQSGCNSTFDRVVFAVEGNR